MKIIDHFKNIKEEYNGTHRFKINMKTLCQYYGISRSSLYTKQVIQHKKLQSILKKIQKHDEKKFESFVRNKLFG